MIQFVLFVVVAFGLSVQSKAQSVGLTLGLTQPQIEGVEGNPVDNEFSFQFGALFYQPMMESIEVRVGALLTQQRLTVGSGANEMNLKMANLNIPLTAGFRFTERFLVFAGPVLSLNVNKECSTALPIECKASDLRVKATDLHLSLGTQFRLTDSLGMELSLDRMNSRPFKGTSGGNLIHVNFQYIVE